MGLIAKDELLDFLRAHKVEFLEKYGVEKIAVFGSVVRGNQTDTSDIDIAIEMVQNRKNIHNFLEFKRFLESRLYSRIDLGIESTLKPAVKNAIKDEIIYV